MPATDDSLPGQVAALAETVRELREELARQRGHQCCGHHQTWVFPASPQPVQAWPFQPIQPPQITCATQTVTAAPNITTWTPDAISGGISTATLPGAITVN